MLLGQRDADLAVHDPSAVAVEEEPRAGSLAPRDEGAVGDEANADAAEDVAPARAVLLRRVEAGLRKDVGPAVRPAEAARLDARTGAAHRPSIDRWHAGDRGPTHDKDRRLAREIQRGFLPKAAPGLAGLKVAGRLWTAEDVGGDCFDFIPTRTSGRECLDVLIGDASGHGVAAALMMAETRAYARALAMTCRDPGELLTLTNRRVADHLAAGHFVTLLLVQVDPSTRTLLYTSAGHLPAYVLDRRGRVRTSLASVGIPIGIDASREYRTGQATRLEPGDLVFLFTDGLVEAASPAGRHFGLARALDLVRTHRRKSPDEILDALLAAVGDFAEGQLHDDVTAVVIQVDPPDAGAQR